MDARTKHVAKESRLVCAAFGILRREHLLVQIFNGAHTPTFADRQVAESRQAVKYATKSSLLILIAPKSKPPDAISRRKYAEIMQENSGLSHGVSYVVTGTGFSGSFQRSVLVGLNLLAPHNMPTNVSATPEAAMAWLRKKGTSAKDAAVMMEMLAELQAAIKEPQSASIEAC